MTYVCVGRDYRKGAVIIAGGGKGKGGRAGADHEKRRKETK